MLSEQVNDWSVASGPNMVPRARKKEELLSAAELGGQSRDGKQDQSSFSEALATLSGAAAEPQRAAASVIAGYANGAEGPMHEGALALEKSDIAFKFLLTAKKEAISAYKELMRTGG